MAKRDIAVTSWTHAEGESWRPHLTDGGSEPTPPRNDLLSTTLLPAITQELESFNTAHEKEPSEESDDQHTSSACEEVQIDKVTATSSDPAPPKPLSDPFETAPSESLRSETSDPVTNSLLLLRHEEKEGSVEGLKEQSKDNPEPFEKIQEDAQTEGVVSIRSSSNEISEKQGRKKRVMKRLGL